jgi:MYXO-CTERM domain-containing protein
VELSEAASKNTTNWFDGLVTPPVNENCAPIPEVGAELEETDGCFFAYGSPKYWRQEAKGHAGGLLWTNAFEADDPSNWARWDLDFVAGGKYTVEVWIDPEFGVYDQVRYEVRANAQQTIVIMDQSKSNGWVSLGDFEFAPGGDQWLSMYDNVQVPVADDQHITADALRLTPEGKDPPPGWQDNPIEPVPDDTPADPAASAGGSKDEAGCACRAAGGSPGNAGALSMLLGLALVFRRRRSARQRPGRRAC